MLKSLLFLLISALYLNAGVISVAVASNVSYAMDELLKEFNKIHPGTEVRTVLGSSGRLSAQIRFGAPYEIFMSANMRYPISLYDSALAVTKPKVYAKGSLVMFSMKKRDFSKGLELLKEDSIKSIAIANPNTAPYGRAAREVLKNSHLLNTIKSKIVYAQSIAQVLSYLQKAADVGFVAKSALFSPKMAKFKNKDNYMEIDSSLYTPIEQGIVILKKGMHNKEVENFYNFILSKKAKEIFKRYGYIVW